MHVYTRPIKKKKTVNPPDGATQAPESDADKAKKYECMGQRAHRKVWVWSGTGQLAIWTHLCVCTNCGEVIPNGKPA